MAHPTKLLGFVSVEIGHATVKLPIHEMQFESDGVSESPGGLVQEGEGLGILVDAKASDSERSARISQAVKEAVQRLSRKFLN